MNKKESKNNSIIIHAERKLTPIVYERSVSSFLLYGE